MSHSHSSLPWLDRLAASLPGYSGYRTAASRRQADQTLRQAVAHRLERAAENLRNLRNRSPQRDTLALDRLLDHIERVRQRVLSASAGVSSFFEARDFRDSKADALHAIDHAMLEVAREFEDLTTSEKYPDHDWLVHAERELVDLEHKLDARAQLHLMAAQGDASKT
ncbi:MAG: hypothetical protein KatS3mg108_3025 [Isosphaeraceae bacterium]|jgi:formate dehydrogenase maturation protein FdhE|nr:MAG: hypothetical protein KatS3mg108_3025 [Isosphaeraceae bacterium]